jgi:ADP-ribose pyrophosphatase YjhB (NUDIX family)
MNDYVRRLRAALGTEPLILVGSSVVVLDEAGRILLIERSDTGDWGLPGGLTDPGEALEDTARREVFEETGVKLEQLTLLGVFSGPEFHYRYPHGDEIHNVTAAYVAHVPAGTIARPDLQEARRAEFFELDAIPAAFLPPERPIVEEYLRSLRGH